MIIGKTIKDAPKDEVSLNAKLLIRGGYVHKELAGVYAILPLGKKVLDKIVGIIREEMEAIGGQELSMTALQNAELWKKSGRWDDEVVDIWFKTELKNKTEVGLAPTHEEPLTNMLKRQVSSYKDLPLFPFQFQTKFRNELRAKSGLLRGREFLMKDLYSFCRTEEELNDFYEKAALAYEKIFKRLGIGDKTIKTFASGGSFSKYSHEFQTICEYGEDTIYISKEKNIAINKEVYNDEVLNELGIKKEDLEEVRAIEVGNIFKLGTKFSNTLDLKYATKEGTLNPVIMGSYGIGVTRVMATIVELMSDDKGLVWPENIAPYKIHLIGLNMDDKIVAEKAEDIYLLIKSKGIEVLFDERMDVSTGQKLNDADLIGIPYRVIVSKKTENQIEVKKRSEDKTELMGIEEFLKSIHNS